MRNWILRSKDAVASPPLPLELEAVVGMRLHLPPLLSKQEAVVEPGVVAAL